MSAFCQRTKIMKAVATPSQHTSRQLTAAAKAIDIPLIDHVIIGRVGADLGEPVVDLGDVVR